MPISCRQHTFAHIHQVRARTLSHRTYVLGPNCAAWPILGQCCLFYMPNRHGKMEATLWLRVKTISFHHEAFAHHQESSLNLKKAEHVASSQVPPHHNEANVLPSNGKTESRWSQMSPLKARTTRWWVADPLCNWSTDLGRDTHSSFAAIQLQGCLGLKWVCHDPKVTFSWLKHSRGDIWILISLYIWKGNLPSLY